MATYLPGVTDFIPDIQPFQPDWATVDKTMRLRQGTYDQNYASLQGTYSGLLNMPQLKQDQISKRDKFLKQAFKNLGDLASVDLSLPENVASANNVFAPLYNDTEFLGNSSISKHYEQQEQYANSLRQQDGGKDFSMDNLNYVRQQKMDYINDNSPESWKKYYSNKRYYEPYYDTKKEIREAMEKFKPSSSSVVRLNGFYKEKIDDASWRQSEIKDYLNGVLSDKAKRQLQIEATVRLGDPNVIATLYREAATKDRSQLKSKIDDIDIRITNEKDPNKRNQYIDLKNQLQSSVQEVEETLSKVQNGDSDFIKGNQERLAYSMYYNQVIDGVSKGFAHEDIKQDITEDTVAFGMWKDAQDMKRFMINEAGENNRFYEGQNREDRRFFAKLRTDQEKDASTAANKNGMAVTFDIPAGPGDVVAPVTLGNLDEQVKTVNQQGYIDSQNLKEHIAEATGTPINKLTAKAVKMYMESPKGKADNEVASFINRSNMRHLTIDDANTTRQQAENYANRKMGGNFDYDAKVANLNKLAKTKEFTLVDSRTGERIKLTPLQVYEAVQDKRINVSSKLGAGRGYYAKFNGKEYDIEGGSIQGFPVTRGQGETLFNFASYARNDNYSGKDLKKYNNYLNEYFGGNKTDLRKGFTFADDSDYVKATKNKLSSLTGLEPTKLAEVGYSPNADRNKIMFTVQGTRDKPVTEDEIEDVTNKLTAKGFPAKFNPVTSQIEVTNSSLDPQLDPFSRMPGYTRQLISTLENRIGKPGTKYQSTFYNLDNRGVKSAYRIDKKFAEEGNSYYLYPSGSRTPISRKFPTAFEAYRFSEQMAANPELAKAVTQ